MVSELDKLFDKASEEEQIEFLDRLMGQEQLTKDQALAILESQHPAESSKLLGQRAKTGVKKAFSWLGQAVATLFSVLLKLLFLLLIAPFFLLSFLKNWFFMSLGLWLLCWFLDFIYRIVVLQQHSTGPFQTPPTSMNDNITTIIIIIAGVLALIGTALQYKGEID